MKRLFLQWFVLFILLSGNGFGQSAISIEAPSPDVTLTVRGPEKGIDYVNPSNIEQLDNCMILLSSVHGERTGVNKTNVVAIQVDRQMKVIRIINPAGANKSKPDFNTSADIEIPQDGFVLLATDNSYASQGYKKFLAENFKEGDVVKLRINGEIQSLASVVATGSKESPVSLALLTDQLFTTNRAKEQIAGKILNKKKGVSYTIALSEESNPQKIKKIKTDKEAFSLDIDLQPGTNYFNLTLSEHAKEIGKTSLTIYRKATKTQEPEVIMWVEQFPNAKTFVNEEAIEKAIFQCKKAGINSLGIDVKGPEGFVSYRKNELSHSPYFTELKNPNKQVAASVPDLLESFVKIAHRHQMKVYTSFNCFTEGNVTTNDYAVLKQHPDWEEVVQRPEDKGSLMKISESTIGQEARAGKRLVLGFVNPANKEVQDFQLLRMEEVIRNYDIDGIVLDRCRYDNLYADFSDITRSQFEKSLNKQGKKLLSFPEDAFKIDSSGKLIEGKYYQEWITFRSMIIKDFTDKVRTLIDRYKKERNPNLKLAAYVGSWFEVYWQNGVNWSSRNFRYNEKLNFPESRIYTPSYYQTGYTANLDFLMIGTYYKTAKEVNKYITLGNILTNGELPLYGSMSLPDLGETEQAEVFSASLKNTSGLMLFDLCYVNWESFASKMRDAIIRSKE